ncbi:RNA pol II accessory factor, Cdc73 family-domain-containing protein [Spinellus fusiger]|nr:RNA pol II accessory factor, Cdc73 family-domain-containing protein [Spinellus fusiger]
MAPVSQQPLTLLRDYTRNNKSVILLDATGQVVTSVADATTVQFGDHSFLRQVPTHFKKSVHGDDTYTLDTLIYLVQNAQLDNSAYIKEGRLRNIEHVSIIDKKKILDYLTGRLESLPNVEESKTEKRALTETAEANAHKKVRVMDDEEFVRKVAARERECTTRSSILKGKKNFDHVVTLAQTLILGKEVPHANPAASVKPGARSSTASSLTKISLPAKVSGTHARNAKLSSKDKIPIIIVPAAPTAKFTLFNIKQFLEDQVYIDSQELRESGIKKPERVTVERKKANGQVVPYYVVDSVTGFKQSDWDRVSCVFVTGQQWQFKGWKWERPVELFNQVKGIYPKWNTDKTVGAAASWAVADLNIHRHKRHMDKAAVSQFWDMMDNYNANSRPYLNY